jgi:hypothetical protein
MKTDLHGTRFFRSTLPHPRNLDPGTRKQLLNGLNKLKAKELLPNAPSTTRAAFTKRINRMKKILKAGGGVSDADFRTPGFHKGQQGEWQESWS